MKKSFLLCLFLFLSSVLTVFYGAGCANKTEKISSYQIDCTLSGDLLSGTEKVTFYNHTENSFTALKFNLFGNAFRKDAKFSPISAQHSSQAYPSGLDYGEMDINSVTTADGAELEYLVCGEDQNILEVQLETEVFPNEFAEVIIDFKLDLANVVARTGVNKNTVNLGNFYPILCGIEDGGFYECVYYSAGDPFYSDCANYNVSLTADIDYVFAASGRLIDSKNAGEKVCKSYELNNARSFAFVLSKSFKVISDTTLGTQIDYYYYSDATPEKSLQTAVDAMKFFEEKFGEYPYPTFAVTQTEFVQGGMEFPALVMIASGLEEKAYREVIVHETAHQWWQTAVGNNEVKYGFLDEGLAEYSVVLFYEAHPDYGYTRESLIKSAEQTYKVFCSVYDKVFGKVNTVMVRPLGEYSGEYEYVNMAYIKPCIMYDYLRESVGEEKFFKGLKKYYGSFKFKNATPYDIAGVYEDLGADVGSFFQSFYEGKVII